jgi:Ca2+-binding EF-hand superfamily protein
LAVKKLASGAEEFSSTREYVQYLFKKFDYNNDGKISFNELSDGLSSLGIYLNLKERQSLMKRFDVNRDGEVTAEELLTVISKVDTKFTSSQLDSSTE